MFRLAVVAGLVAYTAALSSQCLTTITTIGSNPDASKCLATGTLFPIFTTPANSSLVPPLTTWLGNMCSGPACSNATLASIVANLTAGCSTDLNITSDPSTLTKSVQELYPTFRKIFCLKHGSVFCVTETLTNVETITGPLTLQNVVNITQNPPTSLPANITCTDCNKASYNIWVRDVPSTVSSSKSVLESQCGASFVDGSDPSSVSQSASTGVVASVTSPALGLLEILTNGVSVAIAASSFIALSTVYTVLI